MPILQLGLLVDASAAEKEKVIIYHAGSLKVPFAAMGQKFESQHPGIDIVRKAGGSTKMARLISENRNF